MFLIDDLLLLPFKGLMGVLRKVNEMADRELSDADLIREKLMQLRLMFELDEISAEEYERQERQLMEHLDAVQPK
ncbi:MAG: gas vesicle protein GvpG [Thermodesulfovibrionales bacterium]|nr:gas vesicle protein GvpG [Thermodesulfovibrionales bacterium]